MFIWVWPYNLSTLQPSKIPGPLFLSLSEIQPSETACFLFVYVVSSHLILEQSQWGLPVTTQPLKAFKMWTSIMNYHLVLHALVLVGYVFVLFLFSLYCHFRRIFERNQEKMHIFSLACLIRSTVTKHSKMYIITLFQRYIVTSSCRRRSSWREPCLLAILCALQSSRCLHWAKVAKWKWLGNYHWLRRRILYSHPSPLSGTFLLSGIDYTLKMEIRQ